MSRISKVRSKLISFIILHLQTISVILYIIGIVSLFLLPFLSKPVYIDENALSIGAFQPSKEIGGYTWYLEANELYNSLLQEYRHMQETFAQAHVHCHNINIVNSSDSKDNNDNSIKNDNSDKNIQDLEMSMGDEANLSKDYHPSLASPHATSQLQFLKKVENYFLNWGIVDVMKHEYHPKNFPRSMYNLYTSVRASKSSGQESIAIIVPLRIDNPENNYQRLWNIVLGMKLMKHFNLHARWRHKDIIFVISDQLVDDLVNASSRIDKTSFLLNASPFLPEEVFLSQNHFSTGIIREAMILDFQDFNFNYVSLLSEGYNGELPNLDLLNVMNHFAAKEGITTSILPEHETYLARKFINILFFKWNPNEISYDIKRLQQLILSYAKRYIAIWTHMWHQIIGLPTGSHAPFRRKMTHAVTLTNGFIPKDSNLKINHSRANLPPTKLQPLNFIAMARILEPTVRSLNALMEEFHHSFFLYFMDSTQTFLGFTDYSPTMWLVVGALTVIKPIGAFYGNRHSLKNVVRSIGMISYVLVAYGIIIFLTPFAITNILQKMETQLTFSSFLRLWTGITLIICAISTVMFQRFDQWMKNSVVATFKDEVLGASNHKTNVVVSLHETGRLFILTFSGIGILTVLPLSPALAMLLGVYIGILYWANISCSCSNYITMQIFNYFIGMMKSICHYIFNPFAVLGLGCYMQSIQDFLLRSGLQHSMYETLIFPAFSLIAIPTWVMYQLLQKME